MRFATIMLGATIAALAAGPAAAEDGQYAVSLKKMLDQTAAGTCPADIMADRLLSACREQLPAMRAAFAAAGPVTATTFVIAEGQGAARMETYKVTFAKGTTTVWHIGGFHDGKFEAAYSNDG